MATKWQNLAQVLLSHSPLTQFAREEVTRDLASEVGGLALFPLSFSRYGESGALLAAQEGNRRRLLFISPRGDEMGTNRKPVAEFRRETVRITVHDVDSGLLAGLMDSLQWLRPRPNPGRPAIGLGDRLGLATPAHVRAVERSTLFPYLALQSPAELAASGRSWTDVLGDVLFGVLREGFRQGYGADADQLRTLQEVEDAASAGFVRFTLDLSPHVGSAAGLDRKELWRRFVQLENELPGADRWRRRYLGRGFDVPLGFKRRTLMLDERTFLQTMVRYGPVWHQFVEMVRCAQAATRGRPMEVELALFAADEQTPPEAHLFLALEAAEEGVPLHGFAPRFSGRFARCVPYKGNPSKLAHNAALHAGISRLADHHVLAIHSGSDKFDALGPLAAATEGHFYLKTSGTSQVEALRVLLREDRGSFEAWCEAALASLREGSALFELDIDPGKLPAPSVLDDADLEEHFLGSAHGRHLLCETWGTIPRALRKRLLEVLSQREEAHFEIVRQHIDRHVKALTG
jgi:hypothetical protein